MYSIWIDTELIREHNQFSFGSLRTPDRTLSPITGHYQAWCPSWSQYCLFNKSSWHTNVIHWAVVTGLVNLYGMTGYSVDECSCFTVFCLARFSLLEAYLSDRVSGSCLFSSLKIIFYMLHISSNLYVSIHTLQRIEFMMIDSCRKSLTTHAEQRRVYMSVTCVKASWLLGTTLYSINQKNEVILSLFYFIGFEWWLMFIFPCEHKYTYKIPSGVCAR